MQPPLPGKKGLPLQKYKPRLSSGFFTDVLVFDPGELCFKSFIVKDFNIYFISSATLAPISVEKGSESTEVLQKSLQALQHLKKQPNIIPEMEKVHVLIKHILLCNVFMYTITYICDLVVNKTDESGVGCSF